MARSVSEIQQQMLDAIAADPTLSTLLTSTSKRAIYVLYTFIVASGIALMEQLQDIFISQNEAIAAASSPGSQAWLQNKVLQFQYSTITTQVIQLVNFVPTYPIINTNYQIISRCSVTSDIANRVLIKVATGTTPAALSAPQLSALQSYVAQCGVAGVNYVVSSGNPDQLYVQCYVYYLGQYASVIQATVVTAMNNFLAALPFNGQLKVNDLEAAIRAVQGVTDCVLVNVSVRPDGTAFGSGTALVISQQLVGRLWNTVAGYVVGETTTGDTFNDTITYIAQ